MMEGRKSEHTLSKIWFGERGNVWLSITRLPVKVYKELFGCSHCTSPAINKECCYLEVYKKKQEKDTDWFWKHHFRQSPPTQMKRHVCQQS